jgi:hypothetical protein
MAMKLFDGKFVFGSLLVLAAVGVAAGALMTDTLPIVDSGRGALLAVGVIGMAGCAVAGISQAPILGWTSPVVIVGTGLGLVALAVIGAGLFGWDGLLQPFASLVPVGAGLAITTERIAIFALAAVIVLKWLIGTARAATQVAAAA